MYARFITNRRDPYSHLPQGVFQTAYDLRREDRLDDGDRVWFEETVGWFEEHLTSPDYWDFDCRWRRMAPNRAVFWFRPGSQRHISRMWGIVALLRSHGIEARAVFYARPGHVVYRDEHQVAAIPFRAERSTMWGRRAPCRPGVSSPSSSF